MKQKVLNLWSKVPDSWKVKGLSLFNTFSSMFVVTLATSIVATPNIEWAVAFWSGLISAAVREAFKSVVAQFIPVRLGGKK